MKIQSIYNSIQKRKKLWTYYKKEIMTPKLLDTDGCYEFIINYISASEKTKTCLFDNVNKLKTDCPERLSHIVSTFFLGLWFYEEKKNLIHKLINNELSNLRCFENDPDKIDQQFIYVWFMATLFHDLGYPRENEKNGADLPIHEIPWPVDREPVPCLYQDIYKSYYKYRKHKEHGIWAGLQFDKDICRIREYLEHSPATELSWREELEELYHYVAWVILAHNIWFIRDNGDKVKEYHENHLHRLVLSSAKDVSGIYYKEYSSSFENYPLFSFFCIIDTIDPIKSTSCLSDVDIRVESGDIIVKSNDVEYLKKINKLNEWLLPTTMKGDTVTIHIHS